MHHIFCWLLGTRHHWGRDICEQLPVANIVNQIARRHYFLHMASQEKKKKMSKLEKKKMYQDKGKKGAEARGLKSIFHFQLNGQQK